MLKPFSQLNSQLKQRLNALLCALPLLASGPLLATPDDNWQQTLEEAKGQTVYFNAWGGSPEINAYLVWAGQELARDYQVKLVQVKVDDIAQSVSQLLANKQAGKQAGGPIDLLWVNGENFKALKEQGLLGAPFTSELPNMALVDSTLPVSEDFTLPVEGLEAPWGIGQLNLMVDTEEVARAPTSAAALLAWAKAHPGRFTYPKPPQFHGSSFLKQILLELTPDPAPLYREATESDFANVTAPLWAWLDELHPALWRKGKLFPSSAAETRQLLDDGETGDGHQLQSAGGAERRPDWRPAPQRGSGSHGERGAHQQPFSRHPLQRQCPCGCQGGGQLPAEPGGAGAQGQSGLLG